MNRCLIELVEADGGSILLHLDLGRIVRLERIRIPHPPPAPGPWLPIARAWRFLRMVFLPPEPDRRFNYRWTTEKGVMVCYEHKDREPVKEGVKC